ncbi:MAG: DUF362 domain-containing protein [Coriobacteriia bacterium]|nr:DUF362 domain-containing protein [Coriobacteriia bacterium]
MTEHRIVGIERCDTYAIMEIESSLERALAPLGGMAAFVRENDSVFLKVNLLMKAEPDRAVTTHPEFVRAVVRAVKAAGARDIAIGDSPGGRTTPASAKAIFETSGLAAVAREEGARLSLLDEAVVRVPAPGGKLYTSFNLGREAVEADVLIDLPRLKTHGFMMFTGAVKNLFGCIPGLEKAQFHVKVPDRTDFAEMLVDLLLACSPDLSIMDGVIGMEGDGPSGGTPRHVGVVLASADAIALDVVASAIVGFDPMDVYTNRAANGRGLGPSSADEVRVAGTPWRDVAVADFARPVQDLSRRMPPGIGRWMRKRMASRPILEHRAACTSCRTCEKNCPVAAITMSDRTPSFDYDSCIRCYCCQELCPERAIGLKTPWFVRTLVMRGGSQRA